MNLSSADLDTDVGTDYALTSCHPYVVLSPTYLIAPCPANIVIYGGREWEHLIGCSWRASVLTVAEQGGGSSWIAYAESHDALAIGLMHDCVSVGTNGGLVKRDTPRQQSERTTATSVQKNVAHQAGT